MRQMITTLLVGFSLLLACCDDNTVVHDDSGLSDASIDSGPPPKPDVSTPPDIPKVDAKPSCKPIAPQLVEPSGKYVGGVPSIAVDGKGKVHLAYLDLLSKKMTYASNVSGAWQPIDIDTLTGTGPAISLGLDGAGKAHIAYHDASSKNLRYATNASGAWKTTVLDQGNDVGQSPSLAVDPAGNVHITYASITFPKGKIRYATNATKTWKIIDIPGDKLTQKMDMVADKDGKVHISFQLNTGLNYATNMSSTWKFTTLDQGSSPPGISIAVDPLINIYISYVDIKTNSLKFATNKTGKWVITTIASMSKAGTITSLGVDSKRHNHIVYTDYGNKDIRYATNLSGAWKTSLVDSNDMASMPVLAVDSIDRVHLSYADLGKGTLIYTSICPK